jgi:probable rRNA maturation factor
VGIYFFYDDKVELLLDEEKIRYWISKVIEKENKKLGEIVYEFTTDENILQINTKFLNHNYFTDIITFDESFINIINGNIFISIDTVKENARDLDISFYLELYRVIIHGVMHLCGYADKSNEEKKLMRNKEDMYIAYLEKI